MKLKLLIVAAAMWLACTVGGCMWGVVEQYLYARSMPPGQLEVENLKNLYAAKLFDEVISECDRADHDPRYSRFEAQIVYVRWSTDERMGRTDQADAVQQAFLKRFPDNLLAANMHFSNAVNHLTSADFKGAEAELELIQHRYPNASVAGKAGAILTHLHATTPPTSVAR